MQIETLNTVLNSIEGVTFAGLDSVTDVTLLGGKKNEQQGRVKKVTVGNSIMLFTNKNSNGYENMVKRRLEKEGKNPASFKLGELPWGTRIPNTPIIEHKGEHYLQVIFLKSGKTHYELDGKKVDKTEIVGLKPASEGASDAQAGLEDMVIVRTFKLSSITELRVMKEILN